MQERLQGKRFGTTWQQAVRRAREAGVPREDVWDAVLAHIPQVIEARFDPDVLRRTEELGQLLTVRPVTDAALPRGFWGGISIGDGLVGGRTPFSGGTVEGL